MRAFIKDPTELWLKYVVEMKIILCVLSSRSENEVLVEG